MIFTTGVPNAPETPASNLRNQCKRSREQLDGLAGRLQRERVLELFLVELLLGIGVLAGRIEGLAECDGRA